MTSGNGRHGRGAGANGTPVTMSTLPEQAQALLIQLREQGELAWRAIADTTLAVIASGYSAMSTYEAVAGLVGFAPRTVRDYCDTVRAVGDLLDEFGMFTREHWRAMLVQARARAGSRDAETVRAALATIAAEWLETSEKFGGVIVPPVVIWARQNGHEPADKYLAALDRLAACAATVQRHAPEHERAAVAELVARIEALQDGARAQADADDLHEWMADMGAPADGEAGT